MYTDFVNNYFKHETSEIKVAAQMSILHDAVHKKEASFQKWKEILKEINLCDGVVKARDLTASAHRYSYKLAIGTDQMQQGIILNISFLPELIGFYYCNHQVEAPIPIVDHTGLKKELSYYPFSAKQEKLASKILDICNSKSLNFELFDNFFAAQKVNDVLVDGDIYNDIDLFHVFFDHNAVGIF